MTNIKKNLREMIAFNIKLKNSQENKLLEEIDQPQHFHKQKDCLQVNQVKIKQWLIIKSRA